MCLLFDARSDRLVRQLWARLESEGVGTLASHTHGRHHPHLSYAVLRSWDLDGVRMALSALGEPQPLGQFGMHCHGSLVFPRGRVALAPSIPAEVAVRQERVVAALQSAGAELHRHYVRGQWVPHVSVATRASAAQLPVAVKAIADVLPLELRVERAALVDSSTGEVWPLPHLV